MLALLTALLVATAPCEPPLTVRGPELPEAVVEEFAAAAAVVTADVRARLGSTSCEPITITLVPAMEDAPALDPPWHLPSWAAGAAMPRDRRIVVGVTSGSRVQNRSATLVHEVAHVVATDVAGGAVLPRWLDEGIARVIAGEHGPEDLSLLARARVADRFLPLAALEKGFPPRGADASLAYAEAGRAVSLIGEAELPRLLLLLREGHDVDSALTQVTGRAVWQLDRDMQDSVSRFAAFAVVGVETDLALGACGVVVVVAGVRARRRLKQRMAAMDPIELPPLAVLTRWTA